MPNAWFAHDDEKSLMFFAGTMPQWQSVRKVRGRPHDRRSLWFLTTDPNDLVKPIHESVPVLLLKEDGHLDAGAVGQE